MTINNDKIFHITVLYKKYDQNEFRCQLYSQVFMNMNTYDQLNIVLLKSSLINQALLIKEINEI